MDCIDCVCKDCGCDVQGVLFWVGQVITLLWAAYFAFRGMAKLPNPFKRHVDPAVIEFAKNVMDNFWGPGSQIDNGNIVANDGWARADFHGYMGRKIARVTVRNTNVFATCTKAERKALTRELVALHTQLRDKQRYQDRLTVQGLV